jgi:mannitol-specific phosphotransferase system IIBC component
MLQSAPDRHAAHVEPRIVVAVVVGTVVGGGAGAVVVVVVVAGGVVAVVVGGSVICACATIDQSAHTNHVVVAITAFIV